MDVDNPIIENIQISQHIFQRNTKGRFGAVQIFVYIKKILYPINVFKSVYLF